MLRLNLYLFEAINLRTVLFARLFHSHDERVTFLGFTLELPDSNRHAE